MPCDRDRWDSDDCKNDPGGAKNGKMLDLGTLGGTFASANALNNRGQVVGDSNIAGDSISHPFLWNHRRMKDLGTFGGNNGSARWINDAGQVVGRAEIPSPPRILVGKGRDDGYRKSCRRYV
jgi:probable HAF family extracellular repeat protein